MNLEEAEHLIQSVKILREGKAKDDKEREEMRYAYAITAVEILLDSVDEIAELHLIHNAEQALKAARQLNSQRHA